MGCWAIPGASQSQLVRVGALKGSILLFFSIKKKFFSCTTGKQDLISLTRDRTCAFSSEKEHCNASEVLRVFNSLLIFFSFFGCAMQYAGL